MLLLYHLLSWNYLEPWIDKIHVKVTLYQIIPDIRNSFATFEGPPAFHHTSFSYNVPWKWARSIDTVKSDGGRTKYQTETCPIFTSPPTFYTLTWDWTTILQGKRTATNRTKQFKNKINLIVFTDLVPNAQKTHPVSNTVENRLMLCNEIITVCDRRF
jgi:hypothetical protein